MWILYSLIIGAIAGWIAGQIVKGRGFGLLGNIVVGIIGSLLGGFVFSLVGLASYGILGSLIVSVVGAVLLLWLIQFVQKK
jgi:uncharacterized membrane protein YeaQ/YmgE (transglycosylase-associated protein family)